MTAQVSQESIGNRLKVLLVEDDQATVWGLERLLEASGFEVRSAYNGEDARRVLSEPVLPKVLLTDLQLPDADGRVLVRETRENHPEIRTALLTGWDFGYSRKELQEWGIDQVFLKPIDIQALIGWLRAAGQSA